ncbi:MAG: hypothetical protein NTW21_43425 [Verrucomicrobia bacterium]|nr:hypothetical protein [Verrucomicrobiota bacterium]
MKTPVALLGRLPTSVHAKFRKTAACATGKIFAKVLRRALAQETSPSGDQTN